MRLKPLLCINQGTLQERKHLTRPPTMAQHLETHTATEYSRRHVWTGTNQIHDIQCLFQTSPNRPTSTSPLSSPCPMPDQARMEPLWQIQKNMWAKFLSPMKRCLEKKTKKTRTPLVAGDHPENDLPNFCNQDQIKE